MSVLSEISTCTRMSYVSYSYKYNYKWQHIQPEDHIPSTIYYFSAFYCFFLYGYFGFYTRHLYIPSRINQKYWLRAWIVQHKIIYVNRNRSLCRCEVWAWYVWWWLSEFFFWMRKMAKSLHNNACIQFKWFYFYFLYFFVEYFYFFRLSYIYRVFNVFFLNFIFRYF